jgi:glutamate-1-semialdehyde 2,1-aminomutase
LLEGLSAAAEANDIPMRTNQVGAMFGLFFTDQPEVTSFSQVSACDVERFKKFFHGMLKRGVNLAPSAYEAGFVSAMHGAAEIEQTVEAAAATFAEF